MTSVSASSRRVRGIARAAAGSALIRNGVPSIVLSAVASVVLSVVARAIASERCDRNPGG